MTLPREFRRLRICLVGFGDVAKRTLMQRAQAIPNRHGPKLLAIGRSSAAHLPAQVHGAIRKTRNCYLQLDIDRKQDARKMASLAQAAILYVPTADGRASSPPRDPRARAFAVSCRAKAHRFPMVYLSTTGVYGQHFDAIVDETAACRTQQARSQRRLDAEHVLRPLGAHVLRVPGIYDSHDRLPLARLQAQQPALLAQDDVYTNHIHADDLAHIAWIALFRGRPGRVTNAVDATELKMADYFDAVADATGLPRPPRIGRDEMAALARQGAIHPMMMGFLSDSRRVRSKRLSTELGVRLRYPTVHHTLQMRQQQDATAKQSP
jgi:hypothetical protein